MVETARVVVGVDASQESRAALSWAARQARLLGGQLEIVHAYRTPLAYRGTGVHAGVAAPELQQHAEELLQRVQEDLAGELADVPTTAEVAAGEGPADALISRSVGAALLVLGVRGEGGTLGGFRLGSVAFHCVQHAACPVVVVRGPGSPHTRGLGAHGG